MCLAVLYQDLHLLPSTASWVQFLLQQTATSKAPLDLFREKLIVQMTQFSISVSYLLTVMCTTFQCLTNPVPLNLRVMWQKNGKHMPVRGDPGLVTAWRPRVLRQGFSSEIHSPKGPGKQMLRGFDLDCFLQRWLPTWADLPGLLCFPFLICKKAAGKEKEEVALLEARRYKAAGCEALAVTGRKWIA